MEGYTSIDVGGSHSIGLGQAGVKLNRVCCSCNADNMG